MIHVNLDVNEEFYSTFEKLLAGFKKEVHIVNTTKDDGVSNSFKKSIADLKAGRVEEITDLDKHFRDLQNEINSN